VVVPAWVVAGPDTEVVGGTEVVVTEVIVAEVEVAASVVALVAPVTGASTAIGAEVPKTPDELSVTSSTVVPGSERLTFTVATPSVKATRLPAAQSPGAG